MNKSILCTIGPATRDPRILRRLQALGVSLALKSPPGADFTIGYWNPATGAQIAERRGLAELGFRPGDPLQLGHDPVEADPHAPPEGFGFRDVDPDPAPAHRHQDRYEAALDVVDPHQPFTLEAGELLLDDPERPVYVAFRVRPYQAGREPP